LSSETIGWGREIVPFEHLFFSLAPIAPDIDDTVGFRRQRFDASRDAVRTSPELISKAGSALDFDIT
jgi:hypothetical protein